MVGNYLKSGPAATVSKLTQCTVGANGNSEGYPIYWDMTSRYYVEGNMIDGSAAGWEKITFDNGTITHNGKRYSKDPNHYNGDNEEYLTSNYTPVEAGTDSSGNKMYAEIQETEVRIYYSQNDYDWAGVVAYGDVNKDDLAVLCLKHLTCYQTA